MLSSDPTLLAAAWAAQADDAGAESLLISSSLDFADIASAVAARQGAEANQTAGSGSVTPNAFLSDSAGTGWTPLDVDSAVVRWSAHEPIGSLQGLDRYSSVPVARPESLAFDGAFVTSGSGLSLSGALEDSLGFTFTDVTVGVDTNADLWFTEPASFGEVTFNELTIGQSTTSGAIVEETLTEAPSDYELKYDGAFADRYDLKRDFYERYGDLTVEASRRDPAELTYLAEVVTELLDAEPALDADGLHDRLLAERLAAMDALGAGLTTIESSGVDDGVAGAAEAEWLATDVAWSTVLSAPDTAISSATVDATRAGLLLETDSSDDEAEGVASERLGLGQSEQVTEPTRFSRTIAEVTHDRSHPRDRDTTSEARPSVASAAPIDAHGMIDLAALLRADEAGSATEPIAERLAARDAAFALESWRRATPIRVLGPTLPRDEASPNPTIYTDAKPSDASPALAEPIDPTTAERRLSPGGLGAWLTTAVLGGAVLFVRRRRPEDRDLRAVRRR